MSERDVTQASTLQRPPNDDKEAWKAYWKTQGQQWRTEPEIDAERQKHLAERRKIAPDIIQGIYPFKDIKLSRADIEWLLATHERSGMRGPVYWNDESQRECEGPDLRGANLRQANLSGLPLARMMGGLPYEVWLHATQEQREKAAVHLQQADLTGAQLQGAFLREAQLQKANLWLVQLQEADLYKVELQEAFLAAAQLQEAYLGEAQLQGANLRRADLEHAYLEGVTFSDQAYGSARLADINWGEVNLAVLDWEHVTRLGDEQVARQEKDSQGKTKDIQTRLDEHKEAVRANRQLALVLRNQGLNEVADHFAYRAQKHQRVVCDDNEGFCSTLFRGFSLSLQAMDTSHTDAL